MKTLLNTKQLNKHCLVSGCDICLIPLSPYRSIASIVSWPLRPILRPSLIASIFFSLFALIVPEVFAQSFALRRPTVLQDGGCCHTLKKKPNFHMHMMLCRKFGGKYGLSGAKIVDFCNLIVALWVFVRF